MGFFSNCQPNHRFNAYTSDAFPDGPTTWHTIEWDKRRYISTSIPEFVDMSDGGEEMEESVIKALAGLVERLDDNVNLVNFSIDGDFISASSHARDDIAAIPLYCPIDMIPEQYTTGRVISRADLVEVERLSHCVDLVTYRSQPGSTAVFKYQFHHDQVLRNWHELNCWLRLSGHPNIVPLECVVTDFQDVPEYGTDIQVVVGFTSAFVQGKTLQDNPSRLFKLKYLEQLTKVVDDVNLRFGIVHQDIAPRNLLINPATDTLQLFDFSCSGKLGWKGAAVQTQFSNPGSFSIGLNGVVATVYEVITRDTQLAEQILLGADVSTIEEKEWIKQPWCESRHGRLPLSTHPSRPAPMAEPARELDHPLHASFKSPGVAAALATRDPVPRPRRQSTGRRIASGQLCVKDCTQGPGPQLYRVGETRA